MEPELIHQFSKTSINFSIWLLVFKVGSLFHDSCFSCAGLVSMAETNFDGGYQDADKRIAAHSFICRYHFVCTLQFNILEIYRCDEAGKVRIYTLTINNYISSSATQLDY